MEKTDKKVFGPLELPTGAKISFRAPSGRDRVNVIQMMKMSFENIGGGTLLIDNYVAAKCVKEYADKENTSGDYKGLYDSMPQEDADFYVAVFQEMFGMTEDKRSKAKEMASFLLKK